MSNELSIQVGHIYRAKKPRDCYGYFNDRQVLYLSEATATVQYDSPSVRLGRHFPKTSLDKFKNWAGSDVTCDIPEGEWATYERKRKVASPCRPQTNNDQGETSLKSNGPVEG